MAGAATQTFARAGGKHPRAATARQTNGGTTVRPAFIACHSGLPSNFAPPTSTDVATNRDGEARSRRTAPRRAGSRQQQLQNVHFTRWRSLNSHAGHRPSNASRIALRDTVRLRLENAAEEALFAALPRGLATCGRRRFADRLSSTLPQLSSLQRSTRWYTAVRDLHNSPIILYKVCIRRFILGGFCSLTAGTHNSSLLRNSRCSSVIVCCVVD